jgi:hypothetical protein
MLLKGSISGRASELVSRLILMQLDETQIIRRKSREAVIGQWDGVSSDWIRDSCLSS